MELTRGHQRTKIIRQETLAGLRSVLALCVYPAANFYLFDAYTHNPFTSMNLKTQILNILFYVLLAVFLIGIFRRLKVALMVESSLFLILGLANYYVLSFRSTPIMPWDIYSLGTAVSVAGDYDYSLPAKVWWVMAGFLLVILAESRCRWKLPGGKSVLRPMVLLVSAVFLWAYTGMIQNDRFVAEFGLYDKLFTPAAMCRRSGNAVAFIMELEYLRAEKPEGYDSEQVKKLLDEHEPAVEAGTGMGRDGEEKLPNIIVVMNEAFSDLSVLGELDTNEDYMPYLRSLQQGAENTITGTMQVSILGGNTANTEFEFLTGHSMAFLPNGSVPYQQYINGETFSMASYLKVLGYSTTAIHPYYASGWERDQVYPWLGFDEFLSSADFVGKEKIRQYYSDRACYEKIQKLYEEKEDGPLFVFNVTMQNHSSYATQYKNFTPEIYMEGKSSVSLDMYLSLIRESDEALKELIAYFETADEDTMIVFFGDHQPTKSVSSPILRANPETAANVEEGDYYQVPYLIWANFDIEEKKEQETSPNYLGTQVLRQCGIELPAYWAAREETAERYPVLSTVRVTDNSGKDYESGELKKELLTYQQLQYYMMFD